MEMLSNGLLYFQKGGFVMYILLFCSLTVVSIGVERWLYFRTAAPEHSFCQGFCRLLGEGNAAEAGRLAKSTRGFVAEFLGGGLERAMAGRNVAAYLEVQSGIFISHLKRRLYYLSIIVTMAPLLGLLGTIVGMISAFSVFNLESGQATAITGGVGEALIATAFGLCVAILSLVVHSYYTQRIENIITDLEQCCSEVEGVAAEQGA